VGDADVKTGLPYLAGLLGGVVLMLGGPALAADDHIMKADPTAQDFIEALSPPGLTRGIKPREAEPAAQAQPVYSDLPMITFEFDSADLKPEAREVLDQLAAALESDQLGSSRFMIEGHTDAVGDETYNQTLSEQRALAVRQYLAGKQVDAARLETVGKGETELLEAADGEAAVNRRVRIINLGG
jgi:outer membrane protein OmpA-like peptidoglycan-associated protein